jgi:hypothetical protein
MTQMIQPVVTGGSGNLLAISAESIQEWDERGYDFSGSVAGSTQTLLVFKKRETLDYAPLVAAALGAAEEMHAICSDIVPNEVAKRLTNAAASLEAAVVKTAIGTPPTTCR